MLLPKAPGRWELSTTLSHNGRVQHAAISPDGRTVASSSDEQVVRLQDVASGRERVLAVPPGDFRFLYFSPDGRHLAVQTRMYDDPDGSRTHVRVYDVDKFQERVSVRVGWSGRHVDRFSADGKKFIAVQAEGAPGQDIEVSHGSTRQSYRFNGAPHIRVSVWDLVSGRAEKSYAGPSVPLANAGLLPDGRTMLLGSPAWSPKPHHLGLRFWDIISGRELGVLREVSSGPGTGLFAPDGKTLAFTEKDMHVSEKDRGTKLHLYDIPTRRLRTTVDFGPTGSFVVSATFTADGRTLAMYGRIGSHGAVKFFDADSGRLVSSLERDPATRTGVTALNFSADSRTLVLGEEGGSLTVWKWSR
jgi:WD40 repeat protein